MANEVRLINYDAAIDRYYAEYEKQDIYDGAQDRDWLKKCFDEAPTIDPESLRPKGRWEPFVESVWNLDFPVLHSWRCSECGRTEQFKEPYCHCGCKMEG